MLCYDHVAGSIDGIYKVSVPLWFHNISRFLSKTLTCLILLEFRRLPKTSQRKQFSAPRTQKNHTWTELVTIALLPESDSSP